MEEQPAQPIGKRHQRPFTFALEQQEDWRSALSSCERGFSESVLLMSRSVLTNTAPQQTTKNFSYTQGETSAALSVCWV